MLSFPPQRTYRPVQLSTRQTQTWLSTYLTSCESTPYLQPDALLTSSGPTQAQGMSSVTIHNLKRLQAGFNGKYNITALATGAVENERKDTNFKGAVVNVDEIYALDEEWQSKSEFEREQSVEMGENGERDPSHGIAAKSKKKNSSTNGHAEPTSKEARKAAKKERRKALKVTAQRSSKD